jgi:hypothetical protein
MSRVSLLAYAQGLKRRVQDACKESRREKKMETEQN